MAEADFAFPEVHRFSLRFRDPALEATFWTDTAPERAQYSSRNVRPQILVLIPALVVFFATRSSWPASARGGATLAMAALCGGPDHLRLRRGHHLRPRADPARRDRLRDAAHARQPPHGAPRVRVPPTVGTPRRGDAAEVDRGAPARQRAQDLRSHDEVSIVFADLVGFTRLTQRVAPTELAALLDRIFTRLDELAAAEGVEKIKTIGDCYMAAAGLPEACADHALRAARLALAVRGAVAEVCRETGHALEVRIGLDVGPVIAGVLGRNKLVYDLWGDAVNTASRMESHGEPGEIHMSDAFRRVLGDRARVRDRGTIDVKGKGPMQTWFLDGLGAVSPPPIKDR